MSAALYAYSGSSGDTHASVSLAATGNHLKFIRAAILCHAATTASGIPAETASDSTEDLNPDAERCAPVPRNRTLGSAKLSHFGHLSARKE
jgi:hypothetical protein